MVIHRASSPSISPESIREGKRDDARKQSIPRAFFKTASDKIGNFTEYLNNSGYPAEIFPCHADSESPS